MRKAFCCVDCGRLLKDLTQVPSTVLGVAKIEGYCESCHCYSGFVVEIEAPEEDPATKSQDTPQA